MALLEEPSTSAALVRLKIRLMRKGEKGSVWLRSKCERPWKKLQDQTGSLATQQQVQLERYIKVFCDQGADFLTPEMFKREGQFPDGGGGKIAIYVFKPFKWRLYGIVTDVDGLPGFIALGVDPSKKQDKADQDLLKQVAKDGGGLLAGLKEGSDGAASGQKKGSDQGRRKPRH